MEAPSAKILDPFREPAALFDRDGKLILWNDNFLSTGVANGKLFAGFDLHDFGSLVSEAFVSSRQGILTHTHLSHTSPSGSADIETGRREWQVVFVPQPEDQTIMLLQPSERDLAYHDVVTGLPNRRFALEQLQLDWGRMLRSENYNFCLVVADLDNFKQINDRLGHHIGDQALRFVGSQLKAELRSADWVARWGGEEFMFLFYDLGIQMAETVADRIRQKFAATEFVSKDGITAQIRLSMGIADCVDFRVEGQSASNDYMDMVNEAEVLMYDAKLAGRNRVVVATGGEKAYWNYHTLIRALAADSLTVSGKPVADADANQVGMFWVSQVRDAGALAAQHLRRSALQHDQGDKCDAAWLRAAARIVKPDHQGKLAFVQVSANSLMKMNLVNSLSDALGDVIDNGARPVLVVSDQPYLMDLPAATIAKLAELGCDLCLRLTSLNNVPTGLFNALKPRYAYIEASMEPQSDILEDILTLLEKYQVSLLIPAKCKTLVGDNTNWLTVGEA